MCKYFFLLRKLLLPIIKILLRTTGVLPTYETRTRHVPDDRPPEIAIFHPPKFPIFKILRENGPNTCVCQKKAVNLHANFI